MLANKFDLIWFVFVCQFSQDFVHDCKEVVFSYLSNPSRAAKFADRLEEEVVHHGAILQRSVVDNTYLTDIHLSQTPTISTVPSMIAGRVK